MEVYSGYTWKTVMEEASIVIVFLYLRIPMIHLKRAWPTAHLMAFIGNALGGKASGGKKLPDWKVFSPPDFLPFFARPEGFEGDVGLIPPHLCSLLMRALGSGELQGNSWLVQAISLEDDFGRIAEVAEGFDKLDSDSPAAQEADTLARAGLTA